MRLRLYFFPWNCWRALTNALVHVNIFSARQGSSVEEQETHKLLVAGSTPALATITDGTLKKKCTVILLKTDVQETSTKHDYLITWLEAFLMDRKARGVTKGTVHDYQKKLRNFADYCETQAHKALADACMLVLIDYTPHGGSCLMPKVWNFFDPQTGNFTITVIYRWCYHCYADSIYKSALLRKPTLCISQGVGLRHYGTIGGLRYIEIHDNNYKHSIATKCHVR